MPTPQAGEPSLIVIQCIHSWRLSLRAQSEDAPRSAIFNRILALSMQLSVIHNFSLNFSLMVEELILFMTIQRPFFHLISLIILFITHHTVIYEVCFILQQDLMKNDTKLNLLIL
jgi:hypothetical protein